MTSGFNFSPVVLVASRAISRSFACFPPLQASFFDTKEWLGTARKKRPVPSALNMLAGWYPSRARGGQAIIANLDCALQERSTFTTENWDLRCETHRQFDL